MEYQPDEEKVMVQTINLIAKRVRAEAGGPVTMKVNLFGRNREGETETRSSQLFLVGSKGNELRPNESSIRNSKNKPRLSKENQGYAKAAYQELVGMEAFYTEFSTITEVYLEFLFQPR